MEALRDFRCLNAPSTADCYPVPQIQDFTANLAGARIFSKIDLLRGYHQIPVHTNDTLKTYPQDGSNHPVRSMGVPSHAFRPQEHSTNVSCDGHSPLRPDFIFVHLDDILVASQSKQEHRAHVRQVLECLQQPGFVINLAKCQFERPEIDFLGDHITKHGATPLPSKVSAIREFARPSAVKRLQEFIGMVNFYHRFVPAAASIMQPLFQALVGKPKKLEWDEKMISDFNLSRRH